MSKTMKRIVRPHAPSRFVLDRRTLLRGVAATGAVALAIPTLDAMLDSHGEAFADGGALPVRFMTWFFGNGAILDRWTPEGQGTNWELTEELQPLENVREYCNILSGFDVKAGGQHRRGHHDGVAGAFSGFPFIELPANGANYSSKFGGPSIDQVIASIIGPQTYLPSMHVGVSKRVTKGEGPTLQYISHKGPDQPVTTQYEPQEVFDTLFNNYTPEDDPSGPLRVSLLDAVNADVKRLQKRVGKTDKERLDAHLQSIAQLQKQIQAIPPACTVPGGPSQDNKDVDGKEPLEEVSHAMAEMVALAWACDVTRVVSWQQSGSVGGTVYHMTGATTEEHGLSHEPGGQELVHQAVVFNMQCFAYLLQTLKDTKVGAKNLLDQSILYLGSDAAEGITHSIFDQPIIVAGGAGGAFKTPGVHYRSPDGENTSDILLRMLQVFDPAATQAGGDMGASTKPFTGLDV